MAKNTALIEVDVLNWDKHNERSDKKNYVWFKFQNNFFFDAKMDVVSKDARYLFIFLLCEASRNSSNQFTISTRIAGSALECKNDDLINLLNELSDNLTISWKFLENPAPCPGNGRTTRRDKIREEEKREEKTSASGEESAKAGREVVFGVLVNIWNQNRGTLSEVKATNSTRERKATTRWRELPDAEYWAGVVRKIADTPFCRGENKTGWRATFDWLLKPETHLSVMEGKYDNNTNSMESWVPPEERNVGS